MDNESSKNHTQNFKKRKMYLEEEFKDKLEHWKISNIEENYKSNTESQSEELSSDGENDSNGSTTTNVEISPEVQNKVINELKKWIVESGIAHVHVDKLLQILKNNSVLPSLPKNSKTLLKSNKKYAATSESIEKSSNTRNQTLLATTSKNIESSNNTKLTDNCTSDIVPLVDSSVPVNILDVLCMEKNECTQNNLTDPLEVTDPLLIDLTVNQNEHINTDFRPLITESSSLSSKIDKKLILNATPISKLQNVQYKSEIKNFETMVLSKLNSMATDLAHLKNRQDEISNFLLDKELFSLIDSKIEFEKKYNLILPIKDVSIFFKFDEYLYANTSLQNDVRFRLKSCVAYDYSIKKSFVKMLKVFISKEVATKFTAVRKSRVPSEKNEQLKFTTTRLFRYMQTVIIAIRQRAGFETSKKDVFTAISEVIRNARKWN